MSFLNNGVNSGNQETGASPQPGQPGDNAAPPGASTLSEEQMMNMNGGGGMGRLGGMGANMGNGMGTGMGMGGAAAGMGGAASGMGIGGATGMGMGMGMAGLGNPFAMQGQGDMGATASMDGYLGQGGGFVPELDMMALLRAKQKLNMMGRGPGGAVQDKLFALTQDQLNKGPGMGMNRPEDFQVSSAMIDKLKRSADDLDDGDDEPKGKKRKKAKKPNDMPRRALSAYNIFFSEQREIILKEIAAKERVEKMKEEGKSEEEIAESEAKLAQAEADETAEKQKQEEEAQEKDADGVPKVMNRTFFPTRAKRAHRKVHGKIGLVSLAREVSSRWKSLDPEKRKHYQDLAEKDRERHKKVMADYQERKAAENMISMGSPAHESQDAPAQPSVDNLPRLNAEQDIRDSMAHQYQQRLLAEMMAARQQQAAGQMGMMGNPMMGAGMMGMGAMGGMGGMGMGPMMGSGLGGGQTGNLAGLQGGDPSLLGLNMNNSTQAQMWRQMGMGPL